ncbi:MAG: type II secretion system F family protein [Candidatus Altiarchaeota archaeon]
MRIPFMIVPAKSVVVRAQRWRGITCRISNLIPQLETSLKRTDVRIRAEDYISAAIINSIIWGLLFFILIYALLTVVGEGYNRAMLMSAGAFLLAFGLFLVVLLLYPRIMAGKRAESVNKDLAYALKDMLLEVSAGSSLYDAMLNIAKSDYGVVSEEFGLIVKKVDTGVPLDDAMESLALRTSSDYLRNATWQMINALKAGSNIESTLREIVRMLIDNQRNMIRNYAQELNVLSLIYMLFAVVIPTIASTIAIIVAPFLGIAAGPRIFYFILPLTFFIQIALLELIKSRRPVIHL